MIAKETIIEMKNSGSSYSQIATNLKISVNTVKSIIKRAKDEKTKEERYCLNCGARLKMIPKHKKKKFCSDVCRLAYWKKNNRSLIEGICKKCGRTVYYYPSKIKSFCCRSCYLKYVGGKESE